MMYLAAAREEAEKFLTGRFTMKLFLSRIRPGL